MKKKTATPASNNAVYDFGAISPVKIQNVRETDNADFVNFEWAGVTFYSWAVREGKDGELFISPPARKGSDGKWYNYVFAPDDFKALVMAAYKAYTPKN